MIIRQLNCNKAKLAHDNICQWLIRDTRPVLYLLQEPVYYKKRLASIPKGFQAYGERTSRAIIIAPDAANLIYVNQFSGDDITVCLINSGTIKRFIVSVYLDLHKDTIHPLLQKLVDSLTANGENAIIGMDSNAHSSLWNSGDTNKRGEDLEQFILCYNMHICNIGNKATFQPSHGRCSSIIDLTLAIGAKDDIRSWRVRDDYQFSDHNMIEFCIENISFKEKKVPTIDWGLFKKSINLNEASYCTWDYSTIECEAERIESAIKLALCKSTTYKICRPQHARWFTKELQIEKRRIKNLVSQCRTNPTAALRESLKTANKAYFKAVRRAKRKKWQEFCNSIENAANMAKLNRVIGGNNKKTLGLLKHPDGTPTRSIDESIELAMRTFFPGSTLVQHNSDEPESTVRSDKILYDLSFETFITAEKVKMAINSFGPEKSPGPDGIKPKALQNLGDAEINCITNLYKVCIELGYTPARWRKTNVILLAKPGKEDYSKVGSFRPITLSCFLFKTLERLILWELEETSLRIKPLSKNQHAFKKGASTETALSSLTDEIESAITIGQTALAVFCDIEGAFNNVLMSSAIKAMENHEFPQRIINWLEHYLQNRYTKCDMLNVTNERKLVKGIPQGGVLSPLIWNLVFESFLALFKGPVRATGFADDGALLIKGCDPSSMVDLMQSALKEAVNWGTQNGLHLNPVKTVAMFFHRKNKWTMPKKLEMSGTPLEYSSTTKYLGVHLDTRLNWTFHIEKKSQMSKDIFC